MNNSPTHNTDPDRELAFKALSVFIAVIVGLELAPLMVRPVQKWLGKGLNGRAWRASYAERHIPVPDWGPREGFWGDNLYKKVQDAHMGYLEREIHIPGHVDVDAKGYQVVSNSPHPRYRILILGGSVGWGSYASTIHRAYFSQMAYHLGQHGYPVQVIVLAAGAWQSMNELNALRYRGYEVHPDVVIFLDGLNDLTVPGPQATLPERVQLYIQHMREARDFALAHHARVVFAPQPFLLEKQHKTTLEQIIINESCRNPSELVQAYTQLRVELKHLTFPGKAYYVDCSGIFDRRFFTTFTDLWHFSDVGHGRLGGYLAKNVEPILKEVQDKSATARPSPRELTHHPA